MAARASLRRLVVDGVVYRWKVEHAHHVLPPSPALAGRCCEVFTAYVDGRRAAPLRVRFCDGAGQQAGYPSAGVVWTSAPPHLEANLNLPSIARRLIALARAAGWSPEQDRGGLEIADGFALLPALVADPDRTPPR